MSHRIFFIVFPMIMSTLPIGRAKAAVSHSVTPQQLPKTGLPQILKTPRTALLCALSIVILIIQSGCSDKNSSKASPTLVLSECRVPGVDTSLKCATLEVIENRDTKQGRKIGLNVVVMPATSKTKLPDPVFIFAGGPGQAASDLVRLAPAMLGTLNNKRDIVFIDQRGTGKSNMLNCKLPEEDRPEMADLQKRMALVRETFSQCRDELAKRADLTQYGTTTAMADIEEARVALGYSEINLWGASYGSRSAMEYLRRFPASVRTVTIDSVAAPSLILPENFSRDAAAAFNASLDACEKEAQCSKNYPALRRDFAALMSRLDVRPQTMQMMNPLTGLTREATLSRDSFATTLFSSLYVPQMTAMLPEAITQAAKGNYAVINALGLGMVDMEKMAIGMRMSVNCAEDVPRISAEMVSRARATEPFRDYFIREFSTACEVWPKGSVRDDFYTPVKSDKPVLLFSGGLDPVTPPSWAVEVKKTLPNSVHLLAPNAGHGSAHLGCGPKLVKEFIDSKSTASLNGDCLKNIPRPMFFQPMRDKKKVENKSDKDNQAATTDKAGAAK
jgi:pimeloyl-ACP methyl ester carboxylesterase